MDTGWVAPDFVLNQTAKLAVDAWEQLDWFTLRMMTCLFVYKYWLIENECRCCTDWSEGLGMLCQLSQSELLLPRIVISNNTTSSSVWQNPVSIRNEAQMLTSHKSCANQHSQVEIIVDAEYNQGIVYVRAGQASTNSELYSIRSNEE